MNSKIIILGAVGLAAVVYLIALSSKKAPAASAQGVQSGQSASNAGGTLSTLGAWFGAASQLVSAAYDPNAAAPDRNTPVYNPAIVSNPVTPSPAVLPYSYKQATVDVPSLLGTDALFTPGAGSSGAYSEDDISGTAAGPTAGSYWA